MCPVRSVTYLSGRSRNAVAFAFLREASVAPKPSNFPEGRSLGMANVIHSVAFARMHLAFYRSYLTHELPTRPILKAKA
jgi:hypothetical protein